MVKDELNITVGARIRTIRENMGYTRERFSDLCDISDSFLSDVERGNKSLTTKTLYKICSSTNASADYISLVLHLFTEFRQTLRIAVDLIHIKIVY